MNSAKKTKKTRIKLCCAYNQFSKMKALLIYAGNHINCAVHTKALFSYWGLKSIDSANVFTVIHTRVIALSSYFLFRIECISCCGSERLTPSKPEFILRTYRYVRYENRVLVSIYGFYVVIYWFLVHTINCIKYWKTKTSNHGTIIIKPIQVDFGEIERAITDELQHLKEMKIDSSIP